MFQPLSWRHLSVYFQMSKDLVSEITAWESFIWKWHPFPLCCSLFSSWVDMWVFEVTLYILHSHMVHHEKSSFISFFFFYSVLVNQAFSYFSPNAIFFIIAVDIMNACTVNWSIFEELMVFLMLITNYGLRNAAMVIHIDICKFLQFH